MKKTLLATVFMAALFALVSCASKKAAEEEVPGDSKAKLEALAEETGDVEEELKKVICPRCGKVVAIKRR